MTVLQQFPWLTSEAKLSDAAPQHRELHHAALEPAGWAPPKT
jgi:hypothetical protein